MKITRSLGGVVFGVTVALLLISTAAAAGAAPPAPAASTGYDVSYPQCGRRLPAPGAFAIVGVNGGLPYSANTCLLAQYQWVVTSSGTEGPKASLYINTANPGPAVSTHWPTGQHTPKECDGTWSINCAYDYGWNAAGDAFNIAAKALPAGAASSVPWWLDVETANSWNSQDLTTNIEALRGYRDRLADLVPSQPVGIYSAAGAWATITGAGTASSPINGPFIDTLNWVAGATAKTAPSFCSTRSFTGGPVRYAQYVSNGIDNDYPC